MSTLVLRMFTPWRSQHVIFLIGLLIKTGGAALLTDQCPRTLQHFAASWATPVALTFVEAARSGCSWLLAFPAIVGLFYQLQGAGFTFPLFWIDQARAKAALFAVLAGYALPTALMLILQDPVVTAAWQFFPAWMWVAQAAHLFIRPSSHYNTSGYWTVQATDLYVPPIVPPDPATTNLQLAAHVFFQWDAVFTMGPSLLGTLRFARNAKQVVLITLWNVIATVVVGPGAAVSGVLLWREWALNGAPEEPKVSKEE
ncbi:hypothetical protein BGY98DRAFT_956072 [Russula aff. rugulosa BPL654]|nr:hypothetical protein BGY98DRAFT_956072 [Russula aff. rugulosa BPL654]